MRMNKLNKKQITALYILTTAIFLCLIGAFVVLRSDSNKQKQNSKVDTTEEAKQTENTGSDVGQEASGEGTMSVDAMLSELTPRLGLAASSKLDMEKIAYYYEVEEADLEECGGVIGDVALADEIVIMKASDESKVAAIEAGAQKRLASQKNSFQDYIPEQFKRLDDAQVVVNGRYVLYVCSDDVEGIVEAFKSYTNNVQ